MRGREHLPRGCRRGKKMPPNPAAYRVNVLSIWLTPLTTN